MNHLSSPYSIKILISKHTKKNIFESLLLQKFYICYIHFFLTLSKGLMVPRSLTHLNIVALRKTQDARTAEDEKEWEPEVGSGCMILYFLISYLSKTWKLTHSIY